MTRFLCASASASASVSASACGVTYGAPCAAALIRALHGAENESYKLTTRVGARRETGSAFDTTTLTGVEARPGEHIRRKDDDIDIAAFTGRTITTKPDPKRECWCEPPQNVSPDV